MDVFMKNTTLCLVALVTGLLAGSPAMAVDDSDIHATNFTGGDGSYQRAIAKGVTLVIAADPPNTFQVSKTGAFDGADVRIFLEVTKRLGIKQVSWTIVPFDSMVPALLAGRADVVVDNLHETPQRLRVVAFTSPAYWYGSGIAVHKGNPLNIHGWDDFAGKRVGTIRGSINHQLLSARHDLKELNLYTNNEAEFTDLIAGRIDVAMEDDIKIGQFLKFHPSPDIEMVLDYKPLPQEYGYARYALRKSDVDLNDAISRALDEMRADGTLIAIIRQFGYTDRNLWYYPVKN
jgi:polar amino acid transport system substrate-binding protein